MVIKVCLAGATGWAGSELARSIAETADLALVAAVSRKHAGRDLGEVLGEPRLTCPVHRSAEEALVCPCDVFVEYTKPDSAKANILVALERGAHVVVGTSGLAIPSPRSRWIAPWVSEKRGAPPCRRPKFTPSVCPAT